MRDVQCKRCIEYKGNWCDKKRDDPDPDMVRDCHWFRTMTNADRIRAMTDEEMADEFSYPGCHKQSNPEICRKHTGECERCWLDWLRREVEK